MSRLLICTDLDRTLIPNGTQPESAGARNHFAALAAHPEITLIYVTGRHRTLVEDAISNYQLPFPDYVIGDVGTTIYQVVPGQDWKRLKAWEDEIARDWNGMKHTDLKQMLAGIPELRLQPYTKQNDYKLSYYVPLKHSSDELSSIINQRLVGAAVKARLVWSVDETAGIGLLDVLPANASKYHALVAFMEPGGFHENNTVFSGDSGNDIEVLASPIPSVLVANAQPKVREAAVCQSNETGNADKLYLAHGDFMGMNGNYSAGILEGVAHYHPDTIDWMAFDAKEIGV